MKRWGRFQSIMLVSFIWRSLNVCPSPTYAWGLFLQPTTKKTTLDDWTFMKASIMIIWISSRIQLWKGFPFLRVPQVIFFKVKLLTGHWKMDDWNMEDTKSFLYFSFSAIQKLHIYVVSNCGYQRYVHEMFQIFPPCFSLCFPMIAYQRFRGIDLEYLEPFLDVDQHDSNCLHDWIWMCRSFVWKVPNLWFLNW